MGKHFKVNESLFYVENPHVKKNSFLTMQTVNEHLPTYNEAASSLPHPVWDGHDDAISCYYRTWELAFKNLRNANADAGFVSDFIDTAFNGYLFMWDSSFIVMFGKYASRIFNFQKTLDNFYSHQHSDGFICREIDEYENGEQFQRDDPASTGPNVLPWAEWLYYRSTGDKERLERVFDPLCAYHDWLKLNRSWKDGSYWSCGLACGMDNSPRVEKQYNECSSHGFMSWIDSTAQMYLSADILVRIGKEIGREEETEQYRREAEMLKSFINDNMWDESSGYYYDILRDGSINGVKHIGAYWTLLSGIVPENRIDRFISHLDDPNEFKRPNRIPTLSYDTPEYRSDGGYWLGSVWAPTNYMTLCALHANGYDKLAHEIACDYLDNVVEVFRKDGTVYENYAPESANKGKPAKNDFVGWTGLAPISIMFEYVFGIQPDARNSKITWDLRLTEQHGIRNYPLGDATVDLICDARSDMSAEPEIHITSDKHITVEVIYGKNKKIFNT